MAAEGVDFRPERLERSTIGILSNPNLKGVGDSDDSRDTRFASATRGIGPRIQGETRRREAVAIVEDEEDLLSIYSDFLRGHGYDSVFTFVDGESLVAAIAEGHLVPEIILMDYRLPGKNGIEIARGVVELRPKVRVIVTTADDSVVAQVNSLGFRFLLKPFSLAALADLVDQT